jgi:cysteine desulfurase/selenocysteine lyase
MDEVTIYGYPPERGGVVAFNVEGVHPHDLSQLLDRYGVAIRAGHHCAQPIMEKLGLSATVRASFYLYNDFEDVNHLTEAITSSLEFMT